MGKRYDDVTRILKGSELPLGPTEIGLQLGLKYTSASSGVSHSLKRLVSEGLVERVVGAKYLWVGKR